MDKKLYMFFKIFVFIVFFYPIIVLCRIFYGRGGLGLFYRKYTTLEKLKTFFCRQKNNESTEPL